MSAVESSPASTGSHGSSGSGSSDDMMGSGGRRQGRYRARSRSFILEDDEDELPGEVGGGGGAGGGAGRRADHQSSAAAAAAAATANAHRQNRSTKPRQPQVSRSTLRTLCNLSDLPSSPHAAGPPSSAGGGSDSEAAALEEEAALAEKLRMQGAGVAASSKKVDDKKDEITVKILMLGDSGVGKTSLINRFKNNKFEPQISTAGVDLCVTHLKVDGKHIKLQIWDTAGQERFHVITRAFYRGAHGVVLVYDTSDHKKEESFHNVHYWMDSIRTNASSSVETLLVGNKVDRPLPRIETSRGKAMAAEFGIPFFETSAKDGTNVKKSFQTIARAVVKRMAGGGGAMPVTKHPVDGSRKGGKKKMCSIM